MNPGLDKLEKVLFHASENAVAAKKGSQSQAQDEKGYEKQVFFAGEYSNKERKER